MERKYATVNASEFQTAVSESRIDVGTLFGKILETDLDTLRYSVDGSLFVIKADNEEDMAYLRQRAQDEGIGYTEYTYEECLALMQTPEWTLPTELNT